MNAMWIVSANAGRARVFSQADRVEPLEEVGDMVSAAARLRTAETESDRLGQTAAGASGHGTGAAAPGKTYEPHETPAEHEMAAFARDLSDFLLQGFQARRFDQLALVASPEFLGVLRKLLDPQLRSAVVMELNKDYTHASVQQLREQLDLHRPRR